MDSSSGRGSYRGAVCLEGELKKMGGAFNKSAQKRFFCLSSDFITYKKRNDIAGRIQLSDITEIKEDGLSFSILNNKGRTYLLECASEVERRVWVDSIKKNIEKYKERADADKNPKIMEGVLWKQGLNGIWRRRYFILFHDTMIYYFDKAQEKILGSIQLYKVTSLVVDVSKSQPNSFGLVTPERTYNLSTTNKADREVWISQIEYQLMLHKS
eukprot:TRINITY_DN13088_c0_g1_i1.p1 TRINITY_DN13088_c0_g1~~TRINITY_DN13088_c0_g1_i1.p1  ORF type:complete len:213 (-),score=19.76 TRINITY_DN13088_c0_g1_i1:96-734(-)